MPAEYTQYSQEPTTILFGFALGILVPTTAKVAHQSFTIYKRTRSVFKIYIWMIWLLLACNVIQTIIYWLYIRGNIEGSVSFFIGSVLIWTLQTQLFLQIMANRLGLIMVNKTKVKQMKLALLAIVGVINISVACIWIPAHVIDTDSWLNISNYLDHTEKVLYLLLDLALNLAFLHRVQCELIARGMTKYRLLFKFNACIAIVSLLMDIIIIILMSAPNPFLFTQFHPIGYSVKLLIELIMADLIGKIVRRQNGTNNYHSYNNNSSVGAEMKPPKQIFVARHSRAEDGFPIEENTVPDGVIRKTMDITLLSSSIVELNER